MNEESSKLKFLLLASIKFLTNSELAVLFGFAGSPNTCGNKHRRGCVLRRCGSKKSREIGKENKENPFPNRNC
jgi:hypothetical protein